MKESFWLKHDVNASYDPKIQAMMCRYGIRGYGLYWILVEAMRSESECSLMRSHTTWNAIAYRTHETPEDVEKFVNDCINDFQLFLSDDKVFFSKRLQSDLQYRTERARKSAKYRWVNATACSKNAVASKRMTRNMRNDANREEKRREEEIREDKSREEERREEKKEECPVLEHRECSLLLMRRIQERRQQKITEPTLKEWDEDVRLMVDRDKRTVSDIKMLINECHDMEPSPTGFTWRNNILSMSKLRIRWNEGKIFVGMLNDRRTLGNQTYGRQRVTDESLKLQMEEVFRDA